MAYAGSRGRVELQPAWLLHRRPYRDSSQLLEAFSVEYGRVGLVARGVRRAASKWRGVLQPFQPLLLSWSGRGELFTLIGAERRNHLPPLTGDSLMAGFYLNELLLRLLAREDPHPALFPDYTDTVEALARSGQIGPRVRRFEHRLLEELGLAVDMSCEAEGGPPVEADRWYRVDPQAGPRRLRGQPAGALDVPGHVLLGLVANTLREPADLRQAGNLLRNMLERHLGGRPLKSREVMLAMRRGRAPLNGSQTDE